MARPTKKRCICKLPKYNEFVPLSGNKTTESVTISLDEYEVFRLLNLEGKSQNDCALRMNISRPTVSRINDTVCKKLADAICNGKRVLINGGDVEFCPFPRPECANEPHCCHKENN